MPTVPTPVCSNPTASLPHTNCQFAPHQVPVCPTPSAGLPHTNCQFAPHQLPALPTPAASSTTPTANSTHTSCQLDHTSCQLDHTNCQLDHTNCQLDHTNCQLDPPIWSASSDAYSYTCSSVRQASSLHIEVFLGLPELWARSMPKRVFLQCKSNKTFDWWNDPQALSSAPSISRSPIQFKSSPFCDRCCDRMFVLPVTPVWIHHTDCRN